MGAADISSDLAGLNMDVDTDGGIIAEISSRHGHSAQPQSKQVVAVLQAVLDVLQAEGMPRTPTTMFAATMSAMDKPETQASAQVGAHTRCRHSRRPHPSRMQSPHAADLGKRALKHARCRSVIYAGLRRHVHGAGLHPGPGA